jgi:hypothetical protein
MSPSAQAQILEEREKGGTVVAVAVVDSLLDTVVAAAVVDSLLDMVVVLQHGDLSLVVTYDCRIGRTLIHQGSLANNKNISVTYAITLS